MLFFQRIAVDAKVLYDYLAHIRLMDLTRLHSPLFYLAASVMLLSGCSISSNFTSSLETDELYLSLGEEYITDAEYIGYAYEYSGYDDDYGYSESNSFPINNEMAPMNGSPSMLGLGDYFSPWGAMYNNMYNNQFGMNFGYSPYGYNQFGYGYDLYNFGYNQFAYNSYIYGYNPYNPYMYSGLGWNYGYNPYGFNPYYNSMCCGGGWNDPYYGNDTYTTSTTLVRPRTPFVTNSATNSTFTGGRIYTNKSKTPVHTPSTGTQSTQEVQPVNTNTGQSNTRANTNTHSNTSTRTNTNSRTNTRNNTSTRTNTNSRNNSNYRPSSRPASRPATNTRTNTRTNTNTRSSGSGRTLSGGRR